MKWSDREIIYCDNHLLVAWKEAGELVQPQLHEEMRLWVQEQFGKPGRAFLEPVHRLDKPVAGLVLFARTSKALVRLNAALQKREMGKIYRAWVEGWVLQKEGELDHFLLHDAFHAKIVPPSTPGAKQALLSYKVLERKEQSTLLAIELKTGRYHQIRAQLSAVGHPILGDHKYGSRSGSGKIALNSTGKIALDSTGKIALEHVKLSFHHPVTGVLLELTKC